MPPPSFERTESIGGTRPITEAEREKLDEMARQRAGRVDSGDAFVRDNQNGPIQCDDDLAEELAAEYLLSATRGEETHAWMDDKEDDDNLGGPFIETSANTEFAGGNDETNPPDAEQAAEPAAGRWAAWYVIKRPD